MKSKNKIIYNDYFEISAYMFAPNALSKKIKSYSVIVEAEITENRWKKFNQECKDIYVILDLSDSISPKSYGNRAHYLSEIIKHINFSKDRILFYPLGEKVPDVLSKTEANTITKFIYDLEHKKGRDYYRKIGSFIAPTLKSIVKDIKNAGVRSKQSVLMIISDAEIWDWENYHDFLKENEQLRIAFFTVDGNINTKIPMEIVNLNKRYSVISCENQEQLAEKLKELFLFQSLPGSANEQIVVNFHFIDAEATCVIDFYNRISVLDNDKYNFEWSENDQGLLKKFFQRLYLFPAKPQSINIEVQSAKFSPTGTEPIKFQMNLTFSSIDPQDLLANISQYSQLIREAEKKCIQVIEWSWNQQLIGELIQSITDNRNLEKDLFNIECPNRDDCGVENKAENWIAKKPKPTVKCWSCRQILLHKSRLATLDQKISYAKSLLLEIHCIQNSEPEIIDEPILLGKEDTSNFVLNDFTVSENGMIKPIKDQIQHYRLETKNDNIRYELIEPSESENSRKLKSFDIVKSISINLSADQPQENIFHLFLDVSEII